MAQIGISTYSLQRAMSAGEMTVSDVVRWIGGIGADYVEVVPIGFDPSNDPQLVGEIKEAAREAGIYVGNYSVGANLMTDDADAYRAAIETLKRHVEAAAALGSKYMRHDVASFGGTSEQNSIARFRKWLPRLAEGCAEIADYAKTLGVTTSVENHGWFMNGSERVSMLVNEVARDNFRLTLDVGNFVCVDEEPVIAVRRCLPLASVVHFKDFYLRKAPAALLNAGAQCWFESQFGTALCGSVVGWGDLDIPAIAGMLRDGGFAGPISIEFEGAEECRMATKAGLAVLRKLLG